MNNDIVPHPIERNELGLIKNVKYVYTPDGLVDWKAMVPSQFLYINNDLKNRERIEKQYGKSFDEIDPLKDNVKDSDLVILLGGLKYLSRLRGYKSVSYQIHTSNIEYAAVTCQIKFIPNYETEFQEIVFEDNACAHYDNTNDFAKKYLVEIATNRAFCRTIRNFLNINIVSKDELPSDKKEELRPKNIPNKTKHIKTLESLMNVKKVTWEILSEKLKTENKWQDAYSSVEDLPIEIIHEFIERIKNIPS